MFVKLYRYQCPSEHFEHWKIISEQANKIYREYGDIKFERLAHHDQGQTKVIELGFYKSEEDHMKIIEQADKDEPPRSKLRGIPLLGDGSFRGLHPRSQADEVFGLKNKRILDLYNELLGFVNEKEIIEEQFELI